MLLDSDEVCMQSAKHVAQINLTRRGAVKVVAQNLRMQMIIFLGVFCKHKLCFLIPSQQLDPVNLIHKFFRVVILF